MSQLMRHAGNVVRSLVSWTTVTSDSPTRDWRVLAFLAVFTACTPTPRHTSSHNMASDAALSARLDPSPEDGATAFATWSNHSPDSINWTDIGHPAQAWYVWI